MPKKSVMPVMIPAAIARTQLGSLLKQVTSRKARFVITKSGKPTAVLLGVEELDPDFQKSLQVAAAEYKAGKAITLGDYLKRNLIHSRTR